MGFDTPLHGHPTVERFPLVVMASGSDTAVAEVPEMAHRQHNDQRRHVFRLSSILTDQAGAPLSTDTMSVDSMAADENPNPLTSREAVANRQFHLEDSMNGEACCAGTKEDVIDDKDNDTADANEGNDLDEEERWEIVERLPEGVDPEYTKDLVQSLRAIGDNLDSRMTSRDKSSFRSMLFTPTNYKISNLLTFTLPRKQIFKVAMETTVQLLHHYQKL